MLCERPWGVHACGKCYPCLLNRRRLWSTRIYLESFLHDHCAFATLTYREECVPVELVPSHLQKFLKRLRRRYEPARLRHFSVGEYGDKSWRPHYHCALFGVSVADQPIVEDAWRDPETGEPYGFVHLGDLTEQAAMYIGGYVCKKMTAKDSPELLGRHPEFARMSLRPGIGAGACAFIARELTKEGGASALVNGGDVPTEVRVAGKLFPVGRYLRGVLREEVGWSRDTPKEVIVRRALEKSFETGEEVRALERRRSQSALSARFKSKLRAGRKVL